MVTEPGHRDLDDVAMSQLEPHLETVRFRRGTCLMREGSPGDACYFIVSGEARVEVERPDFDSDGVVSYMGPGTVCGEFGLLDGSPRSASVYAHTDVVARRLSAGALRELCDRDPPAGVLMLRWLARNAATKARAFSKDLEEFILTGEPDPAMDALVARSAAAQRSIAGWSEDEVDGLITALATEIAGHADELAAATVAETGIGSVTDKADKNRFASLDVARSLVGKPGVGVVGSSERDALTEIADPMGVVLGLIPMTNPVSTLVFKTLICVKARNALIVSCHRAAANVGASTVDLLHQVLRRHGAPVDLVQSVPRRPTRATTAALMRHPGVALILATGGTAMVKAAYSSGTPAIGVGSGNAPAWICADADVEAAARMVVASKAFDHGIICGSENNLVVDRSLRDSFIDTLRTAGAAVLDAAECDRVARIAFDDQDGRLRHSVLGQAATVIAAGADVDVPAGTRLLVAALPREAVSGPYGREKLAPLLSLFTADGEDDGLRLCRQILGNSGCGHTAIIHTRSERRQLSFAQQMPASRILINSPGAQGCIGLGNGLTPSLTLGCGTYGRNSTTDNVTYTNLVNVKRMAQPLPGTGAPTPSSPQGQS
ncbi:MAG TPA: aldehyde dehydrogenase family protein [Streptosporangiaceae bacterium]